MTKKQQERDEAIASLRELVKPSDKIVISIKSVSRSGMSRRMRVYASDLRDISYLVARAIDWSINDKGILVSGCGMDMTFHLADCLTYALYPELKKEFKNTAFKGNGGSCIDWQVL